MVLDKDYVSAKDVVPEGSYVLHPLQGVCLAQEPESEQANVPLMSGQVLLQLAAGEYTHPQCLKVAKYMARANLNQILGGKPLQSRNLFHTMAKK